ncbi:acetyl-CoA synthetase-like protein [Dentipellis sp. KUC8613]|nr:acetyl-CoA synthetase-like protein [Dentipellis sp. KUC8613]
MSWTPKRSLSEVEALLCAPGQLLELETRLVDGRLQRVYKNLPPSIRELWLALARRYDEQTYLVFEDQRLSYRETLEQSVLAAAVFSQNYAVRKGGKVGICSRNYPCFIVAFWACHLLGAVPVLVNAWLPAKAIEHCLVKTHCKLVLLDAASATSLEDRVDSIVLQTGATGFLVWEHQEDKGQWKGMRLWSEALRTFGGDRRRILEEDPKIMPEDDATIMFTSGTTGLPKGVLSTQRMYLTNLFNVLAPVRRAILRRGENIPQPVSTPNGAEQTGILISVPLFHVTGMIGMTLLGTYAGSKLVLMRKWNPEEGSRLIKAEKVTLAGGVPSMASDLIESSAVGYPLTGMLFGGAPPPDWLARGFRKAFPNAVISQGYGLTENNGGATGISSEDYLLRPTSAGLPAPVVDIKIMKDEVPVPVGKLGEIWIRGPNVMKGYYDEPAATAETVTKDGWLRTGDVGCVDKGGFLYVRDRIKDLIIRGGENIDCVSVENALSADSRLLEVAAVGVPDRRLGELVAVVATIKPKYQGHIEEHEVIEVARKNLPKFAVPVMVIFRRRPLPRNPAGKILKSELRPLARTEWEKRTKHNEARVALVQAKL